MSDPRGSEWRKWDLHVHTPSSIVNYYPGADEEEQWEKFIDNLEALPQEYKVLGINDYLFLDGYERLLNEKVSNNRLENIDLLLPVVEFRISKFAGVDFRGIKRINLHVIFSNEVAAHTIESQLLATLQQGYDLAHGVDRSFWNAAITRDSLADLGRKIKETVPEGELGKYGSDIEEGFNNLNLDEKQLFKSLENHYFTGKYLIAVGKTEWDELIWTDGSISEKKDIINKCHVVFTAAESPMAWENAKRKLKEQGVNDLLLDCSDSHYLSGSNEKDRVGNCFTWIKADTTFEGLRQILCEPKLRIQVQEENPSEREAYTKISPISIRLVDHINIRDESKNETQFCFRGHHEIDVQCEYAGFKAACRNRIPINTSGFGCFTIDCY